MDIPEIADFAVRSVGALRNVTSKEIGDSTIGVNVYEGMTEHDLDLLAASGAKWTKVLFICNLEGRPSFGWDYYDFLVSGLVERGVRVAAQLLRWDLVSDNPVPFECLTFPPPTRNETTMKSWLDFVRESVSRYGAHIRYWEVWNEEDIDVFWPPRPDVREYTELLTRTSVAIREMAPGAEVILGGLCDYDYEASWIIELNQLGALQAVDIIGLHPERSLPELGLLSHEKQGREVRVPYAEMLNQFRAAMGPEASRLRIWDTEVQHTYTTHLHAVKEPHKRTSQVRAKHLLRRFLMEAYLGLEQTFWQQWKAYPHEDHPGQLINLKGEQTHAYAALCHICSVMGERHKQTDIPIEPMRTCKTAVALRDDVVVCSFRRPDGTLLVAYWLAAEPAIDHPVERLDVTIGATFCDPVLVDILAGTVYEPVQVRVSRNDTVFCSLPLHDSPIAITERAALRLNPH